MVMKVVSILASAAGCLIDGGLLTGAAVRNVESNNSLWTGGDDKEKKGGSVAVRQRLQVVWRVVLQGVGRRTSSLGRLRLTSTR